MVSSKQAIYGLIEAGIVAIEVSIYWAKNTELRNISEREAKSLITVMFYAFMGVFTISNLYFSLMVAARVGSVFLRLFYPGADTLRSTHMVYGVRAMAAVGISGFVTAFLALAPYLIFHIAADHIVERRNGE